MLTEPTIVQRQAQPYMGSRHPWHAALQKWAADQGLRWKISDKTWGSRLEIYLTNPEEEPDQERWQTEIAYQLAEG